MVLSWVKSLTKPSVDRQELFEQLMSDSYRQAFHMAYRLTGHRTEAEDLLQETYVRAFRFFHRFDEGLPFTSWLYRIMTNIHIDSIRRKSRLKTVSLDSGSGEGAAAWELPDKEMNSDESVMNGQLDEPFQLGLMAMNSEFRMAVLLADVDGMSYEEIAVIMDTSVGTVRSRIHRGRKQLRDYLVRVHPEVLGGMGS